MQSFASLPEGNGANCVLLRVLNRQKVKGLILSLFWVLVLLLRELTVIQITCVEVSLQRRDNGEIHLT